MFKLDFVSPIGILEIEGTEHFIISVLFVEREEVENLPTINTPQLLLNCYKELDEYFKGELKEFSVRYNLQGTPFQTSVWQALTTVPYGQTATYQDIAQQIENEKAVRAVGMTNSKNVMSIIVPCHRVIGKSGKLTGYAGGLWRKKWLLEHELKYSFTLF